MSRVMLQAKKKDHCVVVGLDHALGWFCQLYGPEDEDGEDVVLIDNDAFFGDCNQLKLNEFIREYAILDCRAEHCISQIALGWDPIEGLPKE